ncbi:OpgC family protein [Aestuariivita boseongensis]|uniref:OpgC family protein n=1 Tax=Aestuariivita boseongensis TaxID=1470562 RepID=UPI0006814D29|nr:OpgC domain-containing protein [Aestuariivita boseongensis]
MATTTPSLDFATPAQAARAAPSATTRDPRLDFFRGIAMYIILVAHIPGNVWTNWIPARFGYSDATEIFVFCSGMASAIAFGGSYARGGWWLGTARVLYRCWQVYWAHIGLFFFVAMYLAALDLSGAFDKTYINTLNLTPFFNDPVTNIVGLFTLTYVPNYFDILPMYLVILAMMPVVMALAGVSLWLTGAASVTLWLAANMGALPLPAEPWSDREWFFNPFGWQLLFFTGFAFMRGWLRPPPVSRVLLWLAVGFVVFSAPFGSWKVFSWLNAAWPDLAAAIRPVWGMTEGLRNKTEFGVLRYMHFLSLAYVAWVAVGPGGSRLIATGSGVLAEVWRVVLRWITKVGQQSLAVFVVSMALARLIGVVFDEVGRNLWTVSAGNLIGFAILTVVAYTVAWFKATPWRRKSA